MVECMTWKVKVGTYCFFVIFNIVNVLSTSFVQFSEDSPTYVAAVFEHCRRFTPKATTAGWPFYLFQSFSEHIFEHFNCPLSGLYYNTDKCNIRQVIFFDEPKSSDTVIKRVLNQSCFQLKCVILVCKEGALNHITLYG